MYIISCYLFMHRNEAMKPKDAYIKFNVQLMRQLKLKDPYFIASLTTRGLFCGGLNLKAKLREQPTEAEATNLFLQEVIEPCLETDDAELFFKLLEAMDEFGGPSKDLSAEIKQHLDYTTNEEQFTSTLGEFLDFGVPVYIY